LGFCTRGRTSTFFRQRCRATALGLSPRYRSAASVATPGFDSQPLPGCRKTRPTTHSGTVGAAGPGSSIGRALAVSQCHTRQVGSTLGVGAAHPTETGPRRTSYHAFSVHRGASGGARGANVSVAFSFQEEFHTVVSLTTARSVNFDDPDQPVEDGWPDPLPGPLQVFTDGLPIGRMTA
jgi:hypothetical protein